MGYNPFSTAVNVIEKSGADFFEPAHLLKADPELNLDYIPNVGRKNVDVDVVMSNSFAFGGTSGVFIARRF